MNENTYLLVFILGIYHGINPGMGWLFATALGLQKQSRHSLFVALIALTTGHAVAIGLVIATVGWIQMYIPPYVLKYATIILLLVFGIYHLVRQKHPDWFAMNVGYAQVALWSLLIATAHGAGIMLLPFIMGSETSTVWNCLTIISLHMIGYFTVCAGASFFVYETLKLTILQKQWINFDLLWSISLIVTALFVWYTF